MVAKPHGQKLVNRVVKEKKYNRLLTEVNELIKLDITFDNAVDVENIAMGVYSPLEGFLDSINYENVLNNMRLSNDIPWTIPIILDINSYEAKNLGIGDSVILIHNETPLAIMEVEDIYKWDKKEYVKKIYKTTDGKHPGVIKTFSKKDVLIGGKILLINRLQSKFARYQLWPIETRILFKEKGWKTIVGFQTRNIPHLGHEYIQKAALTFVDGLFIHPLIGWKRRGDYKDEVIIATYIELINHYAPKDSVIFSVLRMEMRYAGPREAIHHAIIRKNFGCTHFIVGRDHAGVGSFYGPYEAWDIFNEFPDLGITPLFIRESYYCKKCGGMVNEKICPHSVKDRILISGSSIREMIKKRAIPPEYVLRREVAEILLSYKNPFIE